MPSDGGKYGDIGDPWGNPPMIPEGGPYNGGGGGGGGLSGPFIPGFGSFTGGSFQPFGGLPQNPFGGGMGRRLQRGPAGTASAFSGGGRGFAGVDPNTPNQSMTGLYGGGGAQGGRGGMGGAASPMSALDWLRGLNPRVPAAPQQPGPQAPFDPRTEQFNSVFDIINNLITHGVRGDMPGYGGVFGINPPPEIMNALRSDMIGDANANQRAARLGLQSRGDADPSTYGFQSLMSDLQGQRGVSDAMNRANLGLRQGQLDNYWRLLLGMLGETGANERANMQRPQDPGFDWGSLIPSPFGGGRG